jgi:hypothetical protein
MTADAPRAAVRRPVATLRWPGEPTFVRWSLDSPTNGFRAAIFALATATLVVGLCWHQMWRDEIQAWLIVRDSHGVADLLHNLRYEGHPALWYLLLTPFAALGRQPYWMQLAQGIVASAGLAVIVWRGPFSRIELLLLPFGYFMLFEYGVKSRSYALGNVLLFAFCAVYGRRRGHPILLAVILALLANVHALYALVACAAVAAILVDWLVSAAPRQRPRLDHAVAACVFLLGLACAVATAHQPPDSGFAQGWRFRVPLSDLAQPIWPLGGMVLETGNPVLDGMATSVAVALVAISLVRWRRAPGAAAFLAAGALALVTFFFVKYGIAPWHHGVLFIVLIGSIWLARETGGAGLVPRALFGAVLAMQAVHGLYSFGMEAVRPYSNGHAVAELIARNGWPPSTVMALHDTLASTVVGYLGAPSFYYAQGARRGSFVVLDRARLAPVDLDAFFRLADSMRPAPTVLDCGPERLARRPAARGYVPVATFDGSPSQEDCIVYRKPD